MEIMTLWDCAEVSDDFDKDVNAALQAGWALIKRDAIMRQDDNPGEALMFYAELAREAAPAEPEGDDWKKAVKLLYELCAGIQECKDCPARSWCDLSLSTGNYPQDWAVRP